MTRKDENMRESENEKKTPPELQEIEAAVDRLAAHDRMAAPEGLLEQVVQRSSTSLPRQDHPPISISSFLQRPAVRIAAVFVIMLSVGVVAVLVTRPAPVAGPDDLAALEEEFEALAFLEDEWSEFGMVEVSALDRDLESLDAALSNFWGVTEGVLEEESL